jgi:hypothetical protein
MSKETVEEAALKKYLHKKPSLSDSFICEEDIRQRERQAFKAGAEWQKESGKQWTDEEVNSLIHYLSKYSWGHYDPVSSIMKWWELYKQSKSNADN